jgi:hypothetical protein
MAREIHFIYNQYAGNYIVANSNDLNKEREEIGELERALSRLKILAGSERKVDIIVHKGFSDDDLRETLRNLMGDGKVRCLDEKGKERYLDENNKPSVS